MADNISSQFNNLFAGRVPAAQAPMLPSGALPTTAPATVADSITLTRRSDIAAASVPMVAATPDVRQELTTLQADLARINRQVEALIQRIDNQQPGANTITADVAATVAPAILAGGTHATEAGDYLWKIAKEKLGDANRWPEIYALNQEAIGDNPNLISPGLLLKLPATAYVPATTAQVPTPNPFQQPVWPGQTVPLPPMANQPALPALPTNTFPPPVPALPQPPVPFPQAPAMPTYPQTNYPQAPYPQTTYPTNPQPQQPVGVTDVPMLSGSQRVLSDADAQRLASEFGLAPAGSPLTPQLKANVALFLDEMESYEKANKGKVFGPGMEALAANPQEAQQIRASVGQIQQALDILIKAGRLRVADGRGQPVTSLPTTGSFFQLNAQGQEVRDAAGNPVMDEAFISAVTAFKQQQGIHQNYRLADGTYGINEYVGPGTIEALKTVLTQVQAGR